MTDHTQTGEQEAILGALEGHATSNRFLDIGAWNPITFSNTRALFERGWGGILVEPSPGPVKNLVKEYGLSDRVKVIAAAISVNGRGITELQVTDDAVSCRPESDTAKVWEKDGGYFGRLLVPEIPLADLFAQFGGDFQMVSIDTEGTSVDLFAELLRIGVRPRCIVVEHDNRIVELNGFAQTANYRQILLNGNNAVFQWTSGV